MKITDDMLYEHAPQARDLWLSTLQDESALPEHTFSPEFLASLENMEKKQRTRPKKKWFAPARRVAAVFLIVLIGSGTWLSVDADARAALVSWFRETSADTVRYGYVRGAPQERIPDYHCSWLPEEMTTEETDASDYSGTVMYTGPDDTFALFSYGYMHDGTALYLFASDETLIHTELEVNGMHADFYEEPGEGYSNFLIWFDEEHKISFDLHSSLDRDTMLCMAQNVDQGLALELMPEYICSWLPWGYEGGELTRGSHSRAISCLKGDDAIRLDYEYQDGRSADEVFRIPVCSAQKTVRVWGQDAQLYLDTEEGENCLVWADEETGIAFCLTTTESEAVMLRVAEAVCLK